MRTLILFLLVGCRAEPGDVLDDTGDPIEPTVAVTIGGGESSWEPLDDGSELTMVHGPQGGWHMLGSVRTQGMDAIIAVEYVITADEHDGAVISDNFYRVQSLTDPDDETVHTYPGMYGYLTVDELADGELDTPPELLSWQDVTLTMTVTDDSGRTASDTLQVVAAPDEEDLHLVP